MSTPAGAAGRPADRSSLDFPNLRPAERPPKVDSIFDFSDEALQQLRLWLEMHPPAIPIAQVLGFAQSQAQTAQIAASQTTTSTAFTDLPTPGPTLTGLPDGRYLVLVSALMSNNTAGAASLMVPAINGVALSDASAAIIANPAANPGLSVTPIGFALATLRAGNNTITAKYRVNAASTGSFGYRNLMALKYANA